MDFNSDGSKIASCSDDRTVKIWQGYPPENPHGYGSGGEDVAYRCVSTLSGYSERPIYALSWSSVNDYLAIGTGDDGIVVFGERWVDGCL